MIGNR